MEIPNKKFISFLSSYGPSASNKNQYDEYVSDSAKKAGVEPFKLHTDFESLYLSGNEPEIYKMEGAFFIVGTAGDGKTYHCRRLWGWINKKQNQSEDYITDYYSDNIRIISGVNGRDFYIVKDLSELSSKAEEAKLIKLITDCSKSGSGKLCVIAGNNGRILSLINDFLKSADREEYPEAVKRADGLKKIFEDYFLEGDKNSVRSDDFLTIYDVRNQITRELIDSAIKQIAEHRAWETCTQCNCRDKCPILKNRDTLAEQVFGERLKDILVLITENGRHITVRNLFLLLSNIILGYQTEDVLHKKRGRPKISLLSCKSVLEDNENSIVSNPFNNVFGLNLPASLRSKVAIFVLFNEIHKGYETNKLIDTLLMEGLNDDERLKEILGNEYESLADIVSKGVDVSQFKKTLNNYLKREPADKNSSELIIKQFNEQLYQQRRRLFLTLPENNSVVSPWSLCILNYAGDYLKFTNELRQHISTIRLQNISKALIVGLNRFMTAHFTSKDTDVLYVTGSGAVDRNAISPILEVKLDFSSRARKYQPMQCVYFAISEDRDQLPCIVADFYNGHLNRRDKCILKLTPIRFNFLMQLSKGVLLSSFASETIEDIRAFKTKILATYVNSVDEEDIESNDLLNLKLIDLKVGKIDYKSINVGGVL